jgi:hypothetical protein
VEGVTDSGETRKTRPGWALLLLAVGFALGVAGYLVIYTVEPARTLCHDFAQAYALPGEKAGGKTGAPSCATDELRYYAALSGIVVGSVLGLISAVVLLSRSIAATQAGTPWAGRRAAAALASRLDSHLPGGARRTRPGFVTALVAVLMLGAVVAGAAWWRNYRNTQDLRNYTNAGAALATTRLPADLQRESISMCGDTFPLCAQSRLTPPQLQSWLEHFLHGTVAPEGVSPAACARNVKRGGLPCPVTVIGEFGGYPTMGDAFWRFVVVRNGRPPAGALAGRRRYVYYSGSDIYVGPVLPPHYAG